MQPHNVERWMQRSSTSPLQGGVAFVDDRLIIGCGTILLDPRSASSTSVVLATDASHDRMVALLAVAGRGRLKKAALLQLDAALDEWRCGDRALAAIRLAFARLPAIRDMEEAHALFLAEIALDAGLGANELLQQLDYAGCLPLLKDWRTQPRVPPGSGRASGQWTSDAPDVTFVPQSAPAAFKPIADADGTLKPTPVFLRPEDDPEAHDVDEKARRLLDDSVQERIREGRPLPKEVPGGFEIEPLPEGTSGEGSDRAVPQTDAVPNAQPKPAPGGGSSTDDSSRDDKGPACPAQQRDRPRGANLTADLFEWNMSKIVNPLNPTPKWSPDDPNVVSQGYYLPTPTPDGRTSYDDCKQDDTPIPIPDVKRGDMFEFKSKNFSWPLYYTNSAAYDEFHLQVERQNEGVNAEGRGRKVYYCFADQTTASRAYDLLHEEFPNSRFLKCD